jgi:hypothetical protein
MARKKEHFGPWQSIAVTRDGRAYDGRYRLSDFWIEVAYRGWSKGTQRGNTPPDGLAGLMLHELIQEHRE